jgi:NAD-dependent dihydropyrimidine dehydrogenase PreA subunit
MPGVFIDVEVAEDIRGDAEMAKKLEEACPVDIYAASDGGVQVVEENLDECILCELCVKTAPPGGVRVLKLYDGTALER